MKKLFCFILLNVIFLSALSAFAADNGKVCVEGLPSIWYIARACITYDGTNEQRCKEIYLLTKKEFGGLNEKRPLRNGDQLKIRARGGKIVAYLTIGKRLNMGDTVQIWGTTLAPHYHIERGTCK